MKKLGVQLPLPPPPTPGWDVIVHYRVI